MSKILSIIIITVLFNSYSNGQTQNAQYNLSATKFAAKIKELPTAPIVDVRTPDEFSNGHLVNALNYDWRGDKFEKQIALLDKSKPVFVYCLSGGRSLSAALKMRSMGFTQVYNLDGGIIKWRSENRPETTAKTTSNGMSKEQFYKLLNSDKLVLVDFYADWCAPCKKMKPYLDEISKDMANKVVIVRVNADDHQALIKELKIESLPTLLLYKNKKLTWTNVGYIEKAKIVKRLK